MSTILSTLLSPLRDLELETDINTNDSVEGIMFSLRNTISHLISIHKYENAVAVIKILSRLHDLNERTKKHGNQNS